MVIFTFFVMYLGYAVYRLVRVSFYEGRRAFRRRASSSSFFNFGWFEFVGLVEEEFMLGLGEEDEESGVVEGLGDEDEAEDVSAVKGTGGDVKGAGVLGLVGFYDGRRRI